MLVQGLADVTADESLDFGLQPWAKCSSSLALFISPDSGTTCVCSAVLPVDPERSCVLVLRKRTVLGNRRDVMRMG